MLELWLTWLSTMAGKAGGRARPVGGKRAVLPPSVQSPHTHSLTHSPRDEWKVCVSVGVVHVWCVCVCVRVCVCVCVGVGVV